MARNNGFNGSPFFRLVEDEFEKYYLNGIPERGFDCEGFTEHRLEHFGQKYSLEASGESGEGSQLGFQRLTTRAPQIVGQNSNEDVFSSSPIFSQSFEQSSEVHTLESTLSNSSDAAGNKNIPHRASDLLVAVLICSQENKGKIFELASESMDELKKMATEGAPLWNFDLDKNIETLNDIEYLKGFGNINNTIMEIMKMVEVPFKPLPRYPTTKWEYHDDRNKDFGLYNQSASYRNHLHTEGSREIAYIGVKPTRIVELLMDSKQWSLAFSKIVSRAIVLGVLDSSGILEQNYEGTLQVMAAELYAPTPLIPTRETYFARYCKRLSQKTWGVVDVSLETLFQFPSAKRFQRRPSGCLIQEMHDGTSEVTWIEHVKVDNWHVHSIFKPMVTSGFAFSAKRWVETLAQQCALMSASPLTVDGVLIIPEAGMRSLLKLSERMMGSFCTEINASPTNKWRILPLSGVDGDTSLMMTKTYKDDPGRPSTSTVAFATSVEIPATPKQVFDFLSNEVSRTKWDVLSKGHFFKELVRIRTGGDPGNRISLVQVNSARDRISVLYLQQNYRDTTGSYVVYTPLDVTAASIVLNGGNPDLVKILASGFVVLPDVSKMHGGAARGSLLTVAFHIVDDVTTTGERITPASADIMYNVMADAVDKIKKAVVNFQY